MAEQDTQAAAGSIVVYGAVSRADVLRSVLARACGAIGAAVSLELMESGALFRRLYLERRQPRADLVVTRGPYVAEALAREDLIQPYQPPAWPASTLGARESALRSPDWRWMALEMVPFSAVGSPPVSKLQELSSQSVIAIPDPGKAETGTMLLLATLDRSRQIEGDASAAWARWAERARENRLVVADDESTALSLQQSGTAMQAIVATGVGTTLTDLAPMPNAIGVVSRPTRNPKTREVLDWLLSPVGAAALRDAGGGLGPSAADANGLRALLEAAPPLELAWAFERYRAAREGWASGRFAFG